MTFKLSKNFHGVGIGPLSKILAVKIMVFKFGKKTVQFESNWTYIGHVSRGTFFTEKNTFLLLLIKHFVTKRLTIAQYLASYFGNPGKFSMVFHSFSG